MPDLDTLRITSADEAAIDALVDSGFDARATPADLRNRAQRIAGLLALLDHMPQLSTGDLLVPRTLQRIDDARHKERLAQQASALASTGPRLALGELLALAATLLIALSVLWPMLASARSTARQMACQQSLAGAGLGFASYAADNDGLMPAVRLKLGDPWWLPGKIGDDGCAQSNSAHLFHLARTGYAPLDRLSCAENMHARAALSPQQLAAAHDWESFDAVSYSYQNQYTEDRPRIDRGPVIAMLADKNPFFGSGRYEFALGKDQQVRDRAISHNHAAKSGQNVLLTDSRVQWLASPRIANDNIFHVGSNGLDNYTGLESPRDDQDAFLVP